MSDLERKVSAVRFRLRLFRVLDWCLWGLVGGLSAAFVVFLILKLIPNEVPLPTVGLTIVATFLLVAAIAAMTRRLTLVEAAIHADARLELRERLSSAILLAQMHRTEARAYPALEEDARAFAGRISPGRDFRYRLPSHAKHTLWPAMALVAVYFMPQMDLFSRPPAPPPRVVQTRTLTPQEREERADLVRELAKKARQKEDTIADAGEDLELADRLERLSEDLSLGRKGEREVVAEMSRMADELKVRERDISKQTQPFRQLKGLQSANQTRELQQALKDQDFQRAAEQLMQMAQQLQDPNALSPEQMEEMAEELQSLADSLQENQAMSEALNQAAQAMQQAAAQAQQQQGGQQQSNSSSGNEEESSPGESQNSGQQQAANQQGSAGNNNQNGQQSQQQSAQAAAAAMQQAAAQMQDMQAMMQQAAALSELQSQMSSCMGACMSGQMASGQQGKPGAQAGQGSSGQQPGQMPGSMGGLQPGGSGMGPGQMNSQGNWQAGVNPSEGMGSGGPGTGMGGNPPDDGSMAAGFEDSFIPGQQNDGEIIAVFEVDAPAPRGESNLTYTSAPASYQQRAADAITDQEIPAGMRNAVRDYFGTIGSSSNTSGN